MELDIRALYKTSVAGDGPLMALCPYHGDENPSLAIYPDHVHCFGCGVHKRALDFVREFPAGTVEVRYQSAGARRGRVETPYIPKSLVEAYVRRLWEREDKLSYLRGRGFRDETIAELKFGYAFGAYSIPVLDGRGNPVQLRFRRDEDEDDTGPKYYGIAGSNGTRLYLGHDLVYRGGEDVWLCEGEFDAALLHQEGLCAVSFTNGAGAFKPDDAGLFGSSDRIIVAFDQDCAGDAGARRIAEVFPAGRVVRASWPRELGKDLGELITLLGGEEWRHHVEIVLSFRSDPARGCRDREE